MNKLPIFDQNIEIFNEISNILAQLRLEKLVTGEIL